MHNLKWLAFLDLSNYRFKEFAEVLQKVNLSTLNISGNLIEKFPNKLLKVKIKGDGIYGD
ncbi:MAG: hypothetical protein ACFFDH_11240 [Promethearchaeota archaeon]